MNQFGGVGISILVVHEGYCLSLDLSESGRLQDVLVSS